LQRSALAGAILILLLNLGYFWIIARMNRPPKAPAKTVPAPSAAAPASPSASPPPKQEAGAG
jgi:hypothetical protein